MFSDSSLSLRSFTHNTTTSKQNHSLDNTIMTSGIENFTYVSNPINLRRYYGDEQQNTEHLRQAGRGREETVGRRWEGGKERGDEGWQAAGGREGEARRL